jgi:hypothetical protein
MLFRALVLSLCFLTSASLSSQTFAWAKRAGLWAFDLGYGVACDNAGNVYIAGKYEMNANFGGTTVPCAGNHDIYVAKYGPAGDFKWVRTAGGTHGDYAHAMTCDGAGNVYVTGEFEGTTTFSSGVSLTSSGDNDIFLAKYNTNGGLVWVRKVAGGSKSDKGLGISIFGSGIYITGKFGGAAKFGNVTTLTSAGAADIFVARYSTDGAFQWVQRAGGTAADEGYAIANDPAGNVYVTGYFTGSASFGGQSLSSSGGTDIFLAKYNSSGGLVWAKKAGGSANDYGMGVKVSSSYRVLFTGGFRVKSSFGTYTLQAGGGNADIFIASYDSNGNPVWVRKAGGALNDYGRALALDGNSNVFITGNFGSTATFSNTSVTSADSTDIYFASYTSGGDFRWVTAAGGPQDASDPGRYTEMGLSIATDPSGNVVASGTYRSKTSFGTTTLQPWNHTDVYIVKITQASQMRTSEMAMASVSPPDSASFCEGGSVWLKTSADTACSYQWLKDGQPLEDATGTAFKAQQAGRYSVRVVRGEDTVLSEPTLVKVTRRLSPGLTAVPSRFCRDSNSVLVAPHGDDFVYQWKRNGRTLRGATSPTLIPAKDGEYQVRIVQGSCIGWCEPVAVKIENCSTTDTSARKNETALPGETAVDSAMVKIYPNPNSGLFTLELDLRYGQSGKVSVDVLNTMGQVVYHDCMHVSSGGLHHQVELDRSADAGVYFLRVCVGTMVETQRMLLLR